MAHVIFYEKPGCANNTRQKALLSAAGHELDVRNLLTEAWTSDMLRAFFGTTPVALWFNKAAPRVKSGEINPEALDADSAIALMLKEPLLIRRPLIEAQGRKVTGFDAALIEDWIGLSDSRARGADLESCRRKPNETTADAS
ncbi:MAG: ArsC/Spx/MgsR family protein [Methylovirgula sp.]